MNPLRALYDLSAAPCTYDFAAFLALTECARQLSGRAWIDLTLMDRAASPRQEWMAPLILDLCSLLPTVKNYGLAREPDEMRVFEFPPGNAAFPYQAKDVQKLFAQGGKPRCLTAPAHAKATARVGKPYVTLTLRMNADRPERNTKPGDWRKFANGLKDEDMGVVVIPDPDDLLGANEGHGYFNEPWIGWARPAALDVRLRMALYEGAVSNFCGADGPAQIMFYSDAPVVEFDQFRGGAAKGVVGGQYGWSLPGQRRTWADSTVENLRREWDVVKMARVGK